jgi:hypothetical protein
MTFGIGKPDLLAPGEKILAADTPEHHDPAAVDGELFQVIHGTSMATPHVAGAAALLRDLHPDWTPGQIHSALRTTALTATLVRDDGVTPADPFDRGSGRIQLKKAMAPGITFDVPVADYVTHADDLWTVNHPSVLLPVVAPNAVTVTRTAKSELAKESLWTLAVQAPPDLGITVPAAITVPAGGTADFTIGVDKSAVPAGAVRHAQLTLKHKAFVATIPITAVGSRPLPDLVLDLVFFTSPVTAGGSIPAGAVIENVGVAEAAPLRVSLHLSLDQALSPDDVFIGFCNVSAPTAPGATAPCGSTFPLFANVPPGTYYGIAAVDADGSVAESDETNNVAVQATTVTVN